MGLVRIEHPGAVFVGRHQDVVARVELEGAQRPRREVRGHRHLFDPQAIVAPEHLVHEAHHVRADHRRRDPHAAGEIGRDDFVGAGAPGLVGVADVVHARHHPHRGDQLFGRQRDDDVAAVVAGDREHARGVVDAGAAQQLVVGRVTLKVERVRMAFQIVVDGMR